MAWARSPTRWCRWSSARAISARFSMNTQGPDDATMLTLLQNGTDYQKEKFLKPLLNGEKRICYSMTEKAAGADATGMQTRAEKKGNSAYVLNGEKWFSSAASVADIALVMPRPIPTRRATSSSRPSSSSCRTPATTSSATSRPWRRKGPLSHILGGGHAEIEIKDLEVPAENLLGGEGNGFNMGQHRLAYGRLRHGMHNVAMAQRALDLAVGHVTNRSTFGKPLAERQGVQFMLAECASQLYIARLMIMHIAYKAEKGLDLRNENGIAKVYLANMVHKVVGHRDPAPRRARLFDGYAAGRLVHPHPLAAPGRRPGRGPQMDHGPQRHQGVQAVRHHGLGDRRRSALIA